MNGLCIKGLENVETSITASMALHKKGEKIAVSNSSKQGDTILPKLFIACLEEIPKKFELDNIEFRVDGED